GHADLKRFIQIFRRLPVAAVFAVERSQAAKRPREQPPIPCASMNGERTFEMISCLFAVAKPRITISDIVESGGFGIRIADIARERKSLRVKLKRFGAVAAFTVDFAEVIEGVSQPPFILHASKNLDRLLKELNGVRMIPQSRVN